MFKLLNNISIRARMLLSVSLFIATLLYSMYGAYVSLGANIDFAVQEKLGNYYQRPVSHILYDTGLLRVMLIQNASGLNKKDDVEQIVAKISSEMANLKKVQDEVGQQLQFTEEGLKSRGRENLKYETVAAKWAVLASAITADPVKDHTPDIVSFIADIRGMIAHSGDTSNLILDPDLDSYYLMDVTLLALPQSIDRLAEIGSVAYKQLASQSILSKEDEIGFSVYGHLMTADDIVRISGDYDTSFKEDKNFYDLSPSYKKNIQPLLTEYQARNKVLTDMLDELTGGTSIPAAEFLPAWQAAINSAGSLWTASFTELDILLDNRINFYKSQQMQALLVAMMGIIISMVFYQFVLQSLISPLTGLTKTMTDLTNQNLDVTVPYTGAKSEIGKIAAAVEIFKKNAIENRRLELEKIELAEKAQLERKQTMKNISTSFEHRVQGIIDAVSAASVDLSASSTQMSQSVAQSNTYAAGAASDANDTFDNVQSVAAAMEEMSATIQEISSQSLKANEVIGESMQKVAGADVHANALRTATQKVRDVINLIAGIASQINLLALNATIESARAGEAGKGFSVVASEVRNLAGQTDKSIQEIERVIADMNTAASSVIAALDGIKESVEQINITSCGVASAVEEQSAVVNDIAQNMSMATQKTMQVKDSIQTVSGLSSEAELSAQKIQHAVSQLSVQASQLDSEVASFLSELQ